MPRGTGRGQGPWSERIGSGERGPAARCCADARSTVVQGQFQRVYGPGGVAREERPSARRHHRGARAVDLEGLNRFDVAEHAGGSWWSSKAGFGHPVLLSVSFRCRATTPPCATSITPSTFMESPSCSPSARLPPCFVEVFGARQRNHTGDRCFDVRRVVRLCRQDPVPAGERARTVSDDQILCPHTVQRTSSVPKTTSHIHTSSQTPVTMVSNRCRTWFGTFWCVITSLPQLEQCAPPVLIGMRAPRCNARTGTGRPLSAS